ncbi:helix-turn-helix transcriptional regulator [Streptomyces sp. B-S-A8]|uniref:Helix-turn-helix transcriptional regulator n=1 Tax=Streptomyces solicavernae TaxID=3043614 RepID=A0ABT6RMJ7_9ACTN|nr:helix-turn-helix transcriptional regulator [Streptomyces sp. B-S-A8]MDI3385639.1 helix-turn-helix transcriptional regulator [Streptomyces sp. B-S-A8]
MSPRQPSALARKSTVLGRKLGGELLRLRVAAGKTQAEAADALSATATKVVKIERGWVPVRDPDIKALCELYGIEERATADSLLHLARTDRDRRRTRGWWNQYPELRAQVEYVALEDVANRVRTLQIALIPGLFQSPDYARALHVAAGHWEDPDEIERYVEARIARQDRLSGERPIQVWAVIGEGALRQEVGGRDVMRAQLKQLLKLTQQPNIKVQVLPYRAGAHASMAGAFTLMSFAESSAVEVVHLDTPSSTLWLESEQDAAHHAILFDRVARNALSQTDSRSVIRRVIEEI